MKTARKPIPCRGLILIMAFLVMPLDAFASTHRSSLEVQRSIQANWSAVEASKSSLDAEMAATKENLATIEGEIAAVKGTLINASPGSAEQLEAKTRLVELLAAKHLAIYNRDKKVKKICADILGEVLQLEEGLAAMSRIHAAKHSPEMQSFKRNILKYVQSTIDESTQETMNIQRELGNNAEPAVQMWLKNSSRMWDLTATIVQGQLARGPGSYQYSYRTNQINAANFRSMYETLLAKLSADGEHTKQMLSSLKLSAELQVAALIGKQMHEGVGEIFAEIEHEYDNSTGLNRRYDEDYDDLQLVQPDNPTPF